MAVWPAVSCRRQKFCAMTNSMGSVSSGSVRAGMAMPCPRAAAARWRPSSTLPFHREIGFWMPARSTLPRMTSASSAGKSGKSLASGWAGGTSSRNCTSASGMRITWWGFAFANARATRGLSQSFSSARAEPAPRRGVHRIALGAGGGGGAAPRARCAGRQALLTLAPGCSSRRGPWVRGVRGRGRLVVHGASLLGSVRRGSGGADSAAPAALSRLRLVVRAALQQLAQIPGNRS